MRYLHDQRQPVDFLTVTDELERRGQLNDVGGAAYISSLVNVVPSSVHAHQYAQIVQRTSTLRQLIHAAGEIARKAYDESQEVDTVVNESEELIFAISEGRLERDLVGISHIMRTVMDDLDDLIKRKGEVLGVPMGFRDLDKILGGLQDNDLIIIAARPGMGKTSLALTMALNAAKYHQKCVAIFSLEMSNEQLVQRLLSQEARINSQRLRLGQIRDDEWGRLAEASATLSETAIYIDDSAVITPFELRTKARRLHAQNSIDLLIIDYMQLMHGGTRSENRVQEISLISRSLKQLARELRIPVVALSQLSRQVENRADKRPQLSDLRESGCLTGDSLVTLADSGSRIPIQALVGMSGFTIWSLNQTTQKIEEATVTKAFSTGVKKIYRLQTRLGRSIRATGNHKFLTIDGWKRLDELQQKEHIALPRVLSGPEKQEMSDAELGSDIYWDQILTITEGGFEEVYDLTVPGNHNFVANDIIVHNSIEQDADVVMFIYREDQYKEDSERQNIAEIIISKHRHGPTGSVDLYFEKDFTTFREMIMIEEAMKVV
jgi:replicative DNA helicase